MRGKKNQLRLNKQKQKNIEKKKTLNYINNSFNKMNNKLIELTDELRHIREKFNEINLNELKW